MEAVEEKKGQRSFWGKFYNFLAYGGFLVIMFFVLGIIVLVSILTT
jgi:hypothetical protein